MQNGIVALVIKFNKIVCSGSTGKAKGVLHTQAGYMLYAATTFKYVFDHHDDDVFWCTADLGWITGHTYVCYGPLANAATSVMVCDCYTLLPPPRRLCFCWREFVCLLAGSCKRSYSPIFTKFAGVVAHGPWK